MNKHLQSILNLIQQGETLSAEQKTALLKSLKDADKELETTIFKLDKTEKAKTATTILLEETIEELEQKRKSIKAQNRELEVEAALEKIRSSSLAMHTSKELQEVVRSVFERLNELQIELNTAIVITFNADSKDSVWWLLNKKNKEYSRIIIKYAEFPFLKELFKARAQGDKLVSGQYSKKEKNDLFNYFFEYSDFRYTPDDEKKYILGSEDFTFAVAVEKNIAIHFTRYSNKIFSAEENEIFKRFAKVFDQSYTRFLDLQNAEAQARESQVQLGLERVRARTMAMQKSDELQDAAIILFQQIKSLGVETGSCGFNTWNKDEKAATVWMSSAEGGLQAPFKMPHTESEI